MGHKRYVCKECFAVYDTIDALHYALCPRCHSSDRGVLGEDFHRTKGIYYNPSRRDAT